MFQAGRIFAQVETVGEDTLVSSAVDKIAGANFLPRGCLELDPLLVDLNARDFGFLAGHGAIVNSQVMKISVDILPEPVVLITSTGPELQAFLGVVDLARAMIDVAEVAFDAASGADVS